MESDILQTLIEIRNILYVLTAILGVTCLAWVIHWAVNIKANFSKAWEDDFITLADKYFKQADYEKLLTHCNVKLSDHPNHSNATWWLARTKQEMGEHDEADKLFLRFLELQPDLKESHVDPYLMKLSNE